MADTLETLFFFELFVEYVRFDDARKMDKVKPAVGVRLLDFPTLLICRSESHDSSAKSDSDKRLSSSEYFKFGGNSAVYCFNKGKSCLFKINLDSLHTHLSNSPLYTMLLDVGNDIPKLIGSSLMSLAKLTGSIKLAVEKHGIYTSAADGGKKISCLLNLMGERIGTISLAYKMVRLGASLIPNISQSKLEMSPCSKTNIIKSARAEENLNNETDELQPPCPKNGSSTDVRQPLYIDGHPMLSGTSETSKRHVSSVSTQTEHTKMNRSSVAEVKSDNDQLCSTFCPPPLFYSCSRKNQQQLPAESNRIINTTMESLRIVDLKTTDSKNESYEIESVYQIKEPSRIEEDWLLSNSGTQRSQNVHSVPRDAIRQLPLLSTVHVEPSHHNGQLQQPSSVRSDLVHMCMSAQECSPGLTSGKCPQTKVQSASSLVHETVKPLTHRDTVAEHTGGHTHENSNVACKSCISHFISTNKEPVVAKSHQERPFPKQKLRHGLTHSFRLRLKQTKPGLTLHHECTEKFKIKQVEPQRKRSLKPKQDHKSATHSFCRDLNECGETLLNSLETDCVQPETRLSDSQKKSHFCISNSSIEKDFHKKRDKECQVHVQSALGQYFNHSTHDSVSNDEKNPPYLIRNSTDLRSSNGCDMGNDSPYGPSYRSDSSSDSLEPCEYRDDFTSPDPTDGSPNQLSSPEPARPQSSDSSVHRNRLHPVPVKTQTSPKQSHEGTRMTKLHLQTSTRSISSDDGKSRISMHHQINSESYSSLPKSPTVSRIFESLKSDHADESTPVREQFVDKCQPSDDFMLESVSSKEPEKEIDELGSIGFQNKYRPISELVVNQLPGYTL